MEDVDVGRYAKLRRVIVDKGVKIPPRTQIGYDPEEDAKRFTITESGVVVVPKGYAFEGQSSESCIPATSSGV